MAPPPVGAMPEVEDIDARVALLRKEVKSIMSTLTAKERAAQSTCEQEVQTLQLQIARNAQTVQRLQAENEAAEEKIVRLRNDYEIARARRLEVEETFGHVCDDAQPPDGAFSPSGDRTTTPAAHTEASGATSTSDESSDHDSSSESTETPTPQTRRSTRNPRPPKRFSPKLGSTETTAPSALQPRKAYANSTRGTRKVSGHVWLRGPSSC